MNKMAKVTTMMGKPLPPASQTRKSPEEIELKSNREARMKEIQEHFYSVKARLESCKMADLQNFGKKLMMLTDIS
jgi:hypothetical protein